MKKRHSAEQIIRILGEIERSGLKISDACRPQGITEQTYYRWRKKYGGLGPSELKRLRQLEQENARLKKLLAERDLEVEIMKEINAKKW